MPTFRGTLELADRAGDSLPVQVTVMGDQLGLGAESGDIGSWSLSEVEFARTVEGFTLTVDGDAFRLIVDDPDGFWTAISATDAALVDRIASDPSPVPKWWRFWSMDSWRAWWARRGPWGEYRKLVRSLERRISELTRSHHTNQTALDQARKHLSPTASLEATMASLAESIQAEAVEREEVRARRAGVVAPPRPLSPAWMPLAVLVILLGALGAEADEPDVPVAAPPTTAAVATTTAPAASVATTVTTASTSSTSPGPTTQPDVTTTASEAVAAGGGMEMVGELIASFFDVGQGDATLLAGPDFTILIDAGRHDRSDVVSHLQRSGVETIDLLVGTHPHADHIGQLPEVLAVFPVTEVWMSGDSHTTQTFERTLDAIEASDAGYHEPRAGESYDIGSALVEIVNPTSTTGDLHDGAIALRITFGEVSFLFTGDAEAGTEAAMVERDFALEADVLQVGHHGSSTSTSDAFLEAVGPGMAVYSAAAGNQYGHPGDEVIARLLGQGVEVFGTDVHGTVVITTDGSTFSVDTANTGTVTAPAPPTTTIATTTTTTGAAEEASACGSGLVDINTAGFEELQQIIHIGPDRADQILLLRPFSSVDSMDRISGIGPARLADIKAQGVACAG